MWLYRLNHLVGPTVGLYWHLRLEGAVDAIPPTGPLILAANHASFLDPWFLGMAFPRLIRYVVDHRWYRRSPVWTAVFRAFGTEPIRASAPEATVEAVCAILARGEVAGIFPEGRISRDGRVRRVRPGLAWIAARSGAPVVPVGIRGSFESLPHHRRFPRPTRVTVHLGVPIVYAGSASGRLPSPDDTEAFRERIFGEICRLAGQGRRLDASVDIVGAGTEPACSLLQDEHSGAGPPPPPTGYHDPPRRG